MGWQPSVSSAEKSAVTWLRSHPGIINREIPISDLMIRAIVLNFPDVYIIDPDKSVIIVI